MSLLPRKRNCRKPRPKINAWRSTGSYWSQWVWQIDPLEITPGELDPTVGTVTLGTNLELVYFDQMREQLNLEETVAKNVSPNSEMVDWNGGKRHILSYLKDFLFTADRARSPVKVLSGGERNRLLLARLFLRPFNVLVLDEPTNDLDMETLEMLEEMLFEYQGTLILVSHDRYFIDQVATSTLVWEGPGVWKEYVGGYQDWLRQRPVEIPKESVKQKKESSKSKQTPVKKKLSFKEQRELDELPEKMESVETELSQLQDQMQDPEFYKQDSDSVQKATQRLNELESILEELYERFEELDI